MDNPWNKLVSTDIIEHLKLNADEKNTSECISVYLDRPKMAMFPLQIQYSVIQKVLFVYLRVDVDDRTVIEVPLDNDRLKGFWYSLESFRQQEYERIRREHLDHVEDILRDIEL